MEQYPLLTSFAIILVAFALGHIIPVRAYKAGRVPTIICGVIFALLTFVFLWLGLRSVSGLWLNLYGLLAGISLWIFYGEVLETLQSEFKTTTGVEVNPVRDRSSQRDDREIQANQSYIKNNPNQTITNNNKSNISNGVNYGNIPLLIVLGGLLWLVIFRWQLITNLTLIQFINTFYITWSLHVVLLTVYYAPVFGGQTVAHGEKLPARKVWSRTRIIASMIVMAVYVLCLIPAVIITASRASAPVELKVAAGFWLVILGWSVCVEIPKKLF